LLRAYAPTDHGEHHLFPRDANNVDQQTIRQRVRELAPWFHNMDLNGVLTAPDHFLGNYPHVHWEAFRDEVPWDLRGRTVLDVGCNAGFFALEMKQRGADRVVGIDSDPRYLAQARLAADVAGLEIELREMAVYDVAALGERFDLVLFLGVLYHLRHPLLALDLLHEHVVGDLLLCQSMLRGSAAAAALDDDYPFSDRQVFERPEFPRLHFVEHRYAGDPSNWWIPNRAGLEAMLRSAGFRVIAHPVPEVFLCQTTVLASADEDPSLLVELGPARRTAAPPQPRRR
jgi:tRNA (mo5U34)-methyltransferase